MEVLSEGWKELIRLYYQLNKTLTWRDVLLYTSIPVVTWWSYQIFIQPFLSPLRKIPGRPYVPIVGNMFEALKKEAMTNTLEWMKAADSRFIRFYHLFGRERLLVGDPDIVRYINVTNWQNYQHPDVSSSTLLRLAPKFIITTRGEEHKSLKKLLNPSFSKTVVESFCDIFSLLTNQMIEDWEKQFGEKSDCVIEVQNYMGRLTLDAICKCGFDFNMNAISQPDEAGVHSFRRLLLDFRVRLVQMIPLINKLPFKVNVQKAADRKFFNETIFSVFERKKKSLSEINKDTGVEHTGDLLTLLLKARDEEGQGLPDNVILDNIAGFLLAGFETTSTSLTWIFLLLSQNPDAQEKVRKEIQQNVSNGKQFGLHDTEKLTYLHCVIKEALRLYPPVTAYFRQVVKEDVINGYTIPAGTILGISVSALHRHPDNWKDPEKFIPERFMEEYDPQLFQPFANGPLMCIGKKFAMAEIQLVIVTLLRKYRFHQILGYKFRRVQNLTMIPDPPMSLRLERI